MGKKCTKSESEDRVNAIYDLLLRANSRTQIIRYAAENWELGERQTEHYIARARELQKLDAALERPEWLVSAVARLQDYEREARTKGNLGLAVKALETQAKLLRFEMS